MLNRIESPADSGWLGRLQSRLRDWRLALRPVGEWGIRCVGHRQYVGGLWQEIGQHQFNYLRSVGLQPEHVLLDVACGSLRAGVHLIPYLAPGHYLGIDKEATLIQAGIERELPPDVREMREPRFIVSSDFEFEKFAARPDYVWIHSLFTHLPGELIGRCLEKLRPCAHAGTRCYASFFETEQLVQNANRPHDHRVFHYTQQQMADFGSQYEWTCEYVGDWGHPRGQRLVCYRPRASDEAASTGAAAC